MIDLHDVSMRYGASGPWVVRDISLQVPAGCFLVLLGESGSGKTTLMKMINRLVVPTKGRIRVDGRDIASEDPVLLRRKIGYVIQNVGLFPHVSVADNVAVVPRLCNWPETDVRARVDELLQMVGLDPATYRDRRPAQLSGGQRQRVGVARALAARPKLLLMDEPFGAVDPINRETLQIEVSKIHRALGLTTVMVTHDMVEALSLADTIAVVKDGTLRQVGTPRELMRAPADAYVAQLMGMAKEHAERIGHLLEPQA